MLKLCKNVSVEEVKLDDIMKIGNKDVIAKHLVRSYSWLREKICLSEICEHMLVHISRMLSVCKTGF